MADENRGSTRSRFRSLSKWGKVFRDAEPSSSSTKFKLNEDVVDFLKPSTDRVESAKPRAASAGAQWPGMQELKAVQQASANVNGWTKPRRREGLAVSFVSSAPEIIGEGGDEASEPAAAVGRAAGKTSAKPLPEPPPEPPADDDSFHPAISVQSADGEEDDQPMPLHDHARSRQATYSTSPVSSNTRRRRRDMMSNEGMALRRASALYMCGLGDSTQAGASPYADLLNEMRKASVDADERQNSPPKQRLSTPPSSLPISVPKSPRRSFDLSGELRNESPQSVPTEAPQPQPESPLRSLRQSRANYQPNYISRRTSGVQPDIRNSSPDKTHDQAAPQMPALNTQASADSFYSAGPQSPDLPSSLPSNPRTRGSNWLIPDGRRESREASQEDIRLRKNSSPPSLSAPFTPARRALNDPDYISAGYAQRTSAAPRYGSASASPGETSGDLALADWASRVKHLMEVFRLASEKVRAVESCAPEAWLRASVWWYLKGKSGLEVLLQQRSKSHEPPREMLTQPHVDLAKAWWIISDPLSPYDISESVAPVNGMPDMVLRRSVMLLRGYLKSLTTSLQRNQLMPPQPSLIHGQDPQVWIEYPRFGPDVMAVLGRGSALDMLPLGDTRDSFCHGRYSVEAFVHTDDPKTDRVPFPCILSAIRGKREYQMGFTLASQNDAVNLRIGPYGARRGLTWKDVSWKAHAHSIIISLPQGFSLCIKMHESDFRSLWNKVESCRRVVSSFRQERDEELVHEVRLVELQYADPSDASKFPADKIRGCTAMLLEKHSDHSEGGAVRKMHQGFRLLLVTDPSYKIPSCVSHEVCSKSPLLVEFITDSAAGGSAAMVLRLQEDGRQVRVLLVFPDIDSRQTLYDLLTGLSVGPDEAIIGKMTLKGLNVEMVGAPQECRELASLQWQRLGVTNEQYVDGRPPPTVESEHLRIVARHAGGCITDRLNLDKGEMLLRLAAGEPTPTIQMLRAPRRLTIAIDTRQCSPAVLERLTELVKTSQTVSTIRTYTFSSLADLHLFQFSITGYKVQYDGAASTFGIARRMMVVPIPLKWQASAVRIQVVKAQGVTQILAFMDDF
ncbi:hypothetical protein K470DRAFT_259274, partial [Piedraia hortae CBS 480.64]